jgi:anti-sigma factor RsiW
MTDMFCTYSGNRDEAIVAYLYDDIAPDERAGFEAHLAACTVCRAELASFRSVRAQLGEWSPPAFQSMAGQLPVPPRRSLWGGMPVWAQTAAAVLVLGVAAGAANINVHHDATGFTVRTGWMHDAATAAASADPAPWKADVAKLESEVQAEKAAAQVVQAALTAPASARPASSDDELLRKVKAIVEDSEKKEQTELALRIAQVVRERQEERLADLTKIDRVLGAVQTNTGVAVQQQRAAINSLALRVSQTVR